MSVRACSLLAFLTCGCLDGPTADAPEPEPARLHFVEWTTESGLIAEHELSASTIDDFRASATPDERALLPMASGMAIGDVDDDGWTDLLVLTGQDGAKLFRNLTDGTFEDVTKEFELTTDPLGSGPLLADFTGDGLLDLLVGGIGDTHVRFFRNDRGKRFVDATERSRLASAAKVLSVAAGDADGDGDLDVVFSRAFARVSGDPQQSFWINDGTGRFADASERLAAPTVLAGSAITTSVDPSPRSSVNATDAGVVDAGVVDAGAEEPGPDVAPRIEVGISSAFADLDEDGDQDLALLQDQGQSAILENEGTDAGLPVFGTPAALAAGLGRGSALGDYDNDGDLDWFVSGVDAAGLAAFEAGDGNHLYENLGDGSFRDVTERAGVSDGSFAWGTCFEDFDNDGYLDLFQVNGWGSLSEGPDAGALRNDSSRLFHNLGNGRFQEIALAVGIEDEGEGRAVGCFDYDHDGDIDIAVSNTLGELKFYGNTLNPWYYDSSNYLCVSLIEPDGVRTTVGARVTVTTPQGAQTRQVLLGSYLSQTSTELHFGIGAQETVDRVDFEWTDGDTGRVEDWPANNCLQATHLPEEP